jgi:hypothetical protein
MIRIRTTAEFDADGRFTGRTTEPVPPGSHLVAMLIEEAPSIPPVDQCNEPTFVEENGLLLLNVKPLPGALIDIVALIQQARDERERYILGERQ